MLAGTWACRTLRGSIARETGRRTGNVVTVENDVQPPIGRSFTLRDQYTYDARAHVWHVAIGAGSDIELDGDAPPWTGDAWTIAAKSRDGDRVARVGYELRNGQLRRNIDEVAPDGKRVLSSAELCYRGSEPPPASACISASAPARLEQFALDSLRNIPLQTPRGTVEVVVHLRADSTVGSTNVVRSPSPYLTAAVLDMLRSSTFRTAVRDCVPEPSDYRFVANFTGRRNFVIRR